MSADGSGPASGMFPGCFGILFFLFFSFLFEIFLFERYFFLSRFIVVVNQLCSISLCLLIHLFVCFSVVVVVVVIRFHRWIISGILVGILGDPGRFLCDSFSNDRRTLCHPFVVVVVVDDFLLILVGFDWIILLDPGKAFDSWRILLG